MSIGIVLGTGLNRIAEIIDEPVFIRYDEVPGLPVSNVEGHVGRFVIGKIGNTDVVCMQGRVHLYEGYTAEEVVKPIDYMISNYGIEELILTNASGGINESYNIGDVILLTDHISTYIGAPFTSEQLYFMTGVRFPDMTEVYDKRIRDEIKRIALDEGLNIKEGVYLQVKGPCYETPAEIRAYKAFGADLIGMSTVVEAIYAKARGLRVCGLSCITNMAAGLNDEELTHEAFVSMADKVGQSISEVIIKYINH